MHPAIDHLRAVAEIVAHPLGAVGRIDRKFGPENHAALFKERAGNDIRAVALARDLGSGGNAPLAEIQIAKRHRQAFVQNGRKNVAVQRLGHALPFGGNLIG